MNSKDKVSMKLVEELDYNVRKLLNINLQESKLTDDKRKIYCEMKSISERLKLMVDYDEELNRIK